MRGLVCSVCKVKGSEIQDVQEKSIFSPSFRCQLNFSIHEGFEKQAFLREFHLGGVSLQHGFEVVALMTFLLL